MIILPDDVVDDSLICTCPKFVLLMGSKEVLKRRNVKRVLRYHIPNEFSQPEAYAHHLLMLFFPFRNESELLSEENSSYVSKLNIGDVLAIVNHNRYNFKPFGDVVNLVLRNNNFSQKSDSFVDEDSSEALIINQTDISDQNEKSLKSSSWGGIVPSTIPILEENDINLMIRSLNQSQRFIFDKIFSWAKCYVKKFEFWYS